VLGRNRIKYLSSLKIKKYRTRYRKFIMEGDKIVRDILNDDKIPVRQLIATHEWLSTSRVALSGKVEEIIEADRTEIQRISSMETPSMVLAVMDIPETVLDYTEISGSLCIALDTVQDPGNLGTIIRTADWFGIRNILCNEGCADCYNPKVVQASMGALLHMKIHYTALPELIRMFSTDPAYTIYGTFTEGTPFYSLPPACKGMIVFGNESRGISEELYPLIQSRITIPPGNRMVTHVESLNVASAVAIVCSTLVRRC
jgi:RNA methyltransferase, TrmH family